MSRATTSASSPPAASSSASATRRRTIAPPSPSPARRSNTLRADRLLRRRRARGTRPRPAGRRRRGRRRCGCSRPGAGGARRAGARARAARWTAAAAHRAGLRRRPAAPRRARARRVSPTRSAGPLDRPSQLVARHRADEHVVGAEQARQLGVGGAAAVEVGAHGEHDDAAAARSRAARDERRDELAALLLVRAGGEQLLELVDHEHARRRPAPGRRAARRSSRIGCSPGRISARAQLSLPGSTPPASARQQPGPQRPTTCRCRTGRRRASSGAPTSRATSSATSCSRPKKYSASSVSNVARPLYGQTTGALDVRAVRGDEPGALARRLQVDDAAGQLGLQRPGLGCGRPPRGPPTASTRRVASAAPTRSPPRARAARRRGSSASSVSTGTASLAGRGVEAGDQPHGLGVERLEDDRVAAARAARARPPPGRWRAPGPGVAASARRELAQRGAHSARRAVGVVEHQQRRPPGVARPRDRGERGLRGCPCRPRRGPPRPRGGRRAASSAGQPGLAHAVRADERHERAGARGGPLPARPQPAQLAVAADQRRRRRGVELARELGRGGLDVQRRVLAQDRVVQAPQLRPRLDADLLDERAPGVPIGLQRLGLAPAPVQREHPLRVQPLAQGVLGQQRIDLADDLLVAAGGEVGVDGQLGRRLRAAPRAGGSPARANGSSARSASGSPRNSASASRAAPAGSPASAARLASASEPLEAADVDAARGSIRSS